MDLKTFKAPTMGEALSQVKTSMGPDAVILHTRTLQTRNWLGFRRREMVEITAGRGLNVGARSIRRSARPAPGDARGPAALVLALHAGPIRAARPQPGRKRQAPAGDSRRRRGGADGIDQRSQFTQGDDAGPGRPGPSPAVAQIPEELFEHYLRLTDGQVNTELAGEIVKNVHKQVRAEHLSQAGFVREKIADQIDKMLPCAGRDHPCPDAGASCCGVDRTDRRRKNDDPGKAGGQSQAPRKAQCWPDYSRYLSHRRRRSAQTVCRHHWLAVTGCVRG